MTDCSICLDPFNKSSRKQTTCPYCNVGVCRSCIQQFLLMDSATDPVCPSCRAAWSYDFLTEVLTKAFRTGQYKTHRERILLDRERARLPETQEQALAYKNAIEVLKPLDEQIGVLRARIRELPDVVAYNTARKDNHAYMTTMPFNKRLEYYKTEDYITRTRALDSLKLKSDERSKPYYKNIRKISGNTHVYRYVRDHYGILPETQTRAQEETRVEERRVFVRKCPSNTCEGFLSQNLTCGLCGIKACKDCREIKQEDHVCDPTIVETVKALTKEAKSCPKCSALISKIDGCDQMWCTQCKTAFSWRTGAIETSIVHNPHYFQWMRETGRTIARQPGDNPCNIQNQLYTHLTTVKRNGSTSKDNYNSLFLQLNNLNHLRAVDLYNHRGALRELESDEWRRILRVKRMVNSIDDGIWQIALQKKEKAFHKERAICQLLDMYINAGYDILSQIIDSNERIPSVVEELEKLDAFTQDQITHIAKTYGCSELIIKPIRSHRLL